MATHLDLEEQEQLDQLKHFWRSYGNAITWVLMVVMLGFAGWTGWNWWQRDQASKAGGMYDELERAVQASDADRAAKVFAEMQSRYPGTTFTEQAALLTAKAQFDKGQVDAARATLTWLAEHAGDAEYRASARLRLAGILTDAKQYDEALKQLSADVPPSYEALVADRRGDVLLAQGKKAEAVAAFQAAFKAMDRTLDYRSLIEGKLVALGAAPAEEAAAAASQP
jgi:predicted negative regulator of RcsB-dependent stress response